MNTPEKLPSLAISHDGFVFDPSTGDSFVMNPTGLVILQGLQDGLDESQLARELGEQFDVTEDTALDDVTEFLSRLRVMHLI